jgi:hypothetical protein
MVEGTFHEGCAIETDEAATCAKPQIALAVLGNREDFAEREVALRGPGSERVASGVSRLVARFDGDQSRRPQQHDQHGGHVSGARKGRG